MDKAYQSALTRGAIGGAFLAGSTFFATAPTQGPVFALYAAGGIFCGYMGARFTEAVVAGDAKKPSP